ncbi:hypothetical protein B566_EDAN016230, partial [Ephemera danica]
VPKLKLSGTVSRSTTDSDSHNVTVSDANRYDQHYHSSSSGNVTKTVINKDESDRSIVKTSDKSYNITTNIINNSSHFQMPPSSAGLPNRAKYISDYFEKYYGSSWHCVVGSEFGNLVRYQEDLYIHLRVANQRVIIFKTPIITAEAEMKHFQEKVQQATMALEALVTMYEAIETYRNKMDEICSSPTSIERLSEEHEKQQKKITQEFTEDWHKKF